VFKFWNFQKNEEPDEFGSERELRLNGPIAEESWWGDEVTPAAFREELNAGSGDITVWINSPGGDVFAGAEIYTMLKEYPGKVTVKIDALAASAASVIAMAGDSVKMSPVAMLMIHNPSTIAIGDRHEMEAAIKVLDAVKETIMTAYRDKTGMSKAKLSSLMDEETWIPADEAVKMGFADEVLYRDKEEEKEETEESSPIALFSRFKVANNFLDKVRTSFKASEEPEEEPKEEPAGEPAEEPEKTPAEEQSEQDNAPDDIARTEQNHKHTMVRMRMMGISL
jgi:ATP-dependent Clp protease protease subunit